MLFTLQLSLEYKQGPRGPVMSRPEGLNMPREVCFDEPLEKLLYSFLELNQNIWAYTTPVYQISYQNSREKSVGH